MLEFLFDTTRAVVDLVLNGTVARHPDLELIVPHAGATLPMVADRVAAFALLLGVDPAVDVLRDLGRPPLRPRRLRRPPPARRAARRSRRSTTSTTAATTRSRPSSSSVAAARSTRVGDRSARSPTRCAPTPNGSSPLAATLTTERTDA